MTSNKIKYIVALNSPETTDTIEIPSGCDVTIIKGAIYEKFKPVLSHTAAGFIRVGGRSFDALKVFG